MGVVDVKHGGEHELILEWESSASNDMIADSTLALITGIDKSPASVKRKSSFNGRIFPIHADLCPLTM
jgi:cleavage and polyadenylation specificity factor subunit 3